jgi:hypothetical protein
VPGALAPPLRSHVIEVLRSCVSLPSRRNPVLRLWQHRQGTALSVS